MSRQLLRLGLIVLAAAQGLGGLTQLLLPGWFFARGPWVALHPPFNEHLMRDLGAATIAYVVPAVVAAIHPERMIVRTALAATLVFTVSHFTFHATHLEHYTVGDAIAQTLTLAIGILLPIGLLVIHERCPHQHHPADHSRSEA